MTTATSAPTKQRKLDAAVAVVKAEADRALQATSGLYSGYLDYREDFVGLDQPEATFIEHAPEDIGWLLERVAALEEAIDEAYL